MFISLSKVMVTLLYAGFMTGVCFANSRPRCSDIASKIRRANEIFAQTKPSERGEPLAKAISGTGTFFYKGVRHTISIHPKQVPTVASVADADPGFAKGTTHTELEISLDGQTLNVPPGDPTGGTIYAGTMPHHRTITFNGRPVKVKLEINTQYSKAQQDILSSNSQKVPTDTTTAGRQTYVESYQMAMRAGADNTALVYLEVLQQQYGDSWHHSAMIPMLLLFVDE